MIDLYAMGSPNVVKICNDYARDRCRTQVRRALDVLDKRRGEVRSSVARAIR
jgi:hypothetical protein